jgi:glycosyltransferase involved in cell wall biosynthesis
MSLALDVTIVAVRPQTRREEVTTGARVLALRTRSADVVRDAFGTLRRQPRESARIAIAMCRARYRFTAKLKNMAVLGKGLALAQYARREKITHIHAHWLTTPSTVAYIAARLGGISWSISAHRFDLFADNWIAAKVAAADAVRVISERGARDLRARLPANLRDRVKVIHLGVHAPLECSAGAANLGGPPARPLRIAAIGLLVAVKGHRDLIDAVRQLRDEGVAVSCAIVGDGPLHDTLQAHIERLGLRDVIELRGFVAHDRLLDELARGAFDVVVHPSLETGDLHEGIPVSLMEAMGYGIPCVTTRTGSIPELVDESCGIVVEQRDPAALAGGLRKLAAQSELRARLGAAARERIRHDFDVRRTAAALRDLMR